jgi:hypothetical protein
MDSYVYSRMLKTTLNECALLAGSYLGYLDSIVGLTISERLFLLPSIMMIPSTRN